MFFFFCSFNFLIEFRETFITLPCNNSGIPDFSDKFCLNCMFVIDAAVKQLVSRVSLNGVKFIISDK